MQFLPQNTTRWGQKVLQELPLGFFLTTLRLKSTASKTKRAEKIKAANWESKELFGAVTRKSRALPIGRTEAESTGMSTEIHWLMRKTPQKTPPELPASLLEMQQNLPPGPNKRKKTIKITPAKGDTTEIPFDANTLKELVDFPLIFNKKKESTPELPDTRKLPSVGRILQATMPTASREALMRWKVLKIAELGEEGFRELNEMHLRQGAKLHRWIQEFFHTQQIPEEAKSEAGWRSVQDFLPTVEPKIVEAKIVHPFLKYHGIVDCVSIVNSELHVIEWKKSERTKASISATFDAPLQLAAYLGAVNATLPTHGLTTPVLRGAVVVIYTNGTPAHIHTLSSSEIRAYWRSWLFRLQEYWVRARDGTLPEPI